MPFHLPALDHGAVDPSARLYSLRIHGHLRCHGAVRGPGAGAAQHRADTVLTGLLDRSALHDVLAEIEALGLDPVEIRQLRPTRKSQESGDGRSP